MSRNLLLGRTRRSRGAPTVTDNRYWDDVGEDWRRRAPDALWRTHSDAANTELLDRWLAPGRVARALKTDLFDEACTDGLAPLLSERAEVVVGIDISAATIAAARRRRPDVAPAIADIRSLPFADGSFDLVVSTSTLDHFRERADLGKGLSELHRVLKPGGRLVVTLDNPANPIVALRNLLPFGLLNRMGLVPYYVGATCSPAQLARMLDERGFAVERQTAILHCPRALAVLACRLVDRTGGEPARRRLLAWLGGFERLGKSPTRYLTGHFVAASARKR
jgi:SAM-dependent methyltransferase